MGTYKKSYIKCKIKTFNLCSPFYHLDFPMDKLIVTDTDIEFKFSLDLLFDQFSLFSSNHLYSLGPDLTPFYADRLFDYRLKHPETILGLPGELQGVNTGVVLLHLERMRKSEKFNSYLEPEVVDKLCDKFSFKGFIGDQDWWNLVVWDSPQLMHPLPCSFNFQTTEQFNTGPWKEVRENMDLIQGVIGRKDIYFSFPSNSLNTMPVRAK